MSGVGEGRREIRLLEDGGAAAQERGERIEGEREAAAEQADEVREAG